MDRNVSLLSISFSSNDLIGHAWGPDSQEVLDVTLRSDRLIKDLLDFLDARVGKGKYVFAMSADHGVCQRERTEGLTATCPIDRQDRRRRPRPHDRIRHPKAR